MAEHSKIEWTDHTFNPWMGCTAVSPACDHCYAEAQTARFRQVDWGAKAPRKRTSAANWKKPLVWNRKAEKAGKRAKVFCASLADVFDNHKSILPEWRTDLWALIRATPWLDWLLLTKRPQNITKFLPNDWGDGYRNVWLGVTVENQEEANRRIPILLNTPASKRFLSCEPLLGILNLKSWLPNSYECADLCGHRLPEAPDVIRCTSCHHEAKNTYEIWGDEEVEICPECKNYVQTEPVCERCGAYMVTGHPDTKHVNWVICGGESGPGARPMHPDWVRSLQEQCNETETNFFFKQWGSWVVEIDRDKDDPDWRAPYSKYEQSDRYCGLNLAGGIGFHGERYHVMKRVGKKSAGHLLDGVEHREMPKSGGGCDG